MNSRNVAFRSITRETAKQRCQYDWLELNLQELKSKNPEELLKQADELGIENPSSLRKQDLMFSILKTKQNRRSHIYHRT